jgi:putative endopeptidase
MRYIIITFFSILFLNACQTKNKNDIDVVAKNVDTTISPDEDFFLFAVGKWIKENPIPNAYSNWGIGNLVQEQIWKQLKEINENEAKKETKIGNFYKAAMDSISIEKQGIKALEKELNWISSIQNMEQLAEITAYLHQIGVPVFLTLAFIKI